MTSYSTYGVSFIRLTDGALSPDDETREEQVGQLRDCLAAGAIRALLDTTNDLADPDADVTGVYVADQPEGWEHEAVVSEDYRELLTVCESFAEAMAPWIFILANRIAYDRRWAVEGGTWVGDTAMAVYRVGMLLGYTMHGDGIGFHDYYQANPTDHVDPNRDGVIDRFDQYCERNKLNAKYEGTWIDSTEEPCLLHLD